jgi:hypothetical protein
MILPTKHTPPWKSLLGVSAYLLTEIRGSALTVNRLWEQMRSDARVGTFERFVLALDLLYIMGAIESAGGRMRAVL